MKYKVGVARLPERGWERQEAVGWLIRTIRAMDNDERISHVVSILPTDSTPAPMLRNEIVVQAKRAKCDYLLSVDSDMVPDLPGQRPFWPVAWEFMMNRREVEEEYRDKWYDPEDEGWPGLLRTKFPPATIAAPYCGPSPTQSCYVFQWASNTSGKPDQDFRLEMVPRESAAVRSGIQEAAALPTGLILYDMRVFDVLPPPWYRYEFEDGTESRKATTEDVYQTRNASLLGLPQFCAWDCFCGHLKTEVVGRPTILTRDHVHSSLVEAVKRGIDSGDRLVVLPRSADVERVDDPLQGVPAMRGAKTAGGLPPHDAVEGRPPVLVQGVFPGGAGGLPQGVAPPAEGPLARRTAEAAGGQEGPAAGKVAFDPMNHEVPFEDLAALRELAARARRHGNTAVEVGAWAGRSTLVLADLLYDVFAVDHWLGSDRLEAIVTRLGSDHVFQTFCRNMGDRLFLNVFPCWGTSESWAAVWPESRPIDFLFIDADHAYKSVRDDITAWLPHVRKGGLIVCHDHGVFDGVTRAVDELLPGRKLAGRTLAYWTKP